MKRSFLMESLWFPTGFVNEIRPRQPDAAAVVAAPCLAYTESIMASMQNQWRLYLMIGASLLFLGLFIIVNDWFYRIETQYRDLQINCYRLATDWQNLVGNIRGLVYVFEPLANALETTRALQDTVRADMAALGRQGQGQIDPAITTSVGELVSGIRAGMVISQDIIAAADDFLAQPDNAPGMRDGRISMANFLGRDVSPVMSARAEFSYFQLVRRIKEMNALFDELYGKRLNRLLDTIYGRVTAIRQDFSLIRLGILGLAAVAVGVTVWQLYGLNRFLHKLARRTGEELVTTRVDLSEAKTNLENARFQQSLFEMVTGVSHELNTPLGSSITLTSFLADEFRGLQEQMRDGTLQRSRLDRTMRECLSGFELLQSSLGRMKTQIDTFKQLASANHDASRKGAIGDRYLSEVATRLRLRFGEGLEVAVAWEGGGTCPVSVESIDTILVELTENSIAHGGATRVDIHFTREPDRLDIRFQDNGKGIGSQDPDRLAEPFFTTARGQKHMGLGLSIVTSIVTSRLGGALTFRRGEPGLLVTIAIPLLREG
jgi:signal transduction histidine kinase